MTDELLEKVGEALVDSHNRGAGMALSLIASSEGFSKKQIEAYEETLGLKK